MALISELIYKPSMEQKNLWRKITVALIADVKSYSRFIGEDEVGLPLNITTYQKIMTPRIQEHRD